MAQESYIPLARNIANWSQQTEAPITIGINGAQGTGKSTLSEVVALALEHEHQLSAAIISIDDIYLTHQERINLGDSIHPLLKTRGVPGTHDVDLGIEMLMKLKNNKAVRLTTFDKASDDRTPEKLWKNCPGNVDVIIFEGWCVGAIPEADEELLTPCNELEATEDADGRWRTYANEQLKGKYSTLFGLLDYLIMLKAPDFESVHEWRSVQEDKLRERSEATGNSAKRVMTPDQISRFIMHYERLTRWMLSEMPQRADCLLELDTNHEIHQTSYLNSDH